MCLWWRGKTARAKLCQGRGSVGIFPKILWEEKRKRGGILMRYLGEEEKKSGIPNEVCGGRRGENNYNGRESFRGTEDVCLKLQLEYIIQQDTDETVL